MKRMLRLYLTGVFAMCLLASCEKEKDNKNPEDDLKNYTETAFDMDLEMVYVKGGTFLMGATEEQGSESDEDEKPVRNVTLDGFYIGETEVTQAQWKAVMGTTLKKQCSLAEYDWGLVGEGDNYPMYYVNWVEAQEFCKKLSEQTGKTYRLPTEAEWEYAARGGQQADSTKYAGSNKIGNVAWYGNNSGNLTHPVSQKDPNGLGLYDMSGNVWEWCSDWFGEYDPSDNNNPQGPDSGTVRVKRGGGWGDDAKYHRVSYRDLDNINDRFYFLGFRVVCEL